ncbi:MAG: DUF5946 family protein [bacterium]
MINQKLYDELSIYTLEHKGPDFIHQYVVDTYTAQNATLKIPSISITCALVGLYLHCEKGFTGREVQKFHMKMIKQKKTWPTFDFPTERGSITIADVLNAPAGELRDNLINTWSKSVWTAWTKNKSRIEQLIESELGDHW